MFHEIGGFCRRDVFPERIFRFQQAFHLAQRVICIDWNVKRINQYDTGWARYWLWNQAEVRWGMLRPRHDLPARNGAALARPLSASCLPVFVLQLVCVLED